MNGRHPSQTNFRKHSAYMRQEETLYDELTVEESITFAFQCKTKSSGTKAAQITRITHIIESLNLENERYTFVKKLSGGQKKRCSIALLLVDNPSILFIDEPTTGLDSSSARQCIEYFKKLSESGITVICTIHTPSSTIFNSFDSIYALSDGACIYHGSPMKMHNFLDELNLPCPSTYNLYDHLIEISSDIYGQQNHRLLQRIENGKCRTYMAEEINSSKGVENDYERKLETSKMSVVQDTIRLIKRNALLNFRDRYSLIRLIALIFLGILFGLV